MLEAYSLLLRYNNNATTYSGKIKDVDAHSFATDGAVEDKKKKPLYSGRKGLGTGGGGKVGSTGGDNNGGSTTMTAEPNLSSIQCFRCRILGYYRGDFLNKKNNSAPADGFTKVNMVVEEFTTLMMGELNLSCYSDISDEFWGC